MSSFAHARAIKTALDRPRYIGGEGKLYHDRNHVKPSCNLALMARPTGFVARKDAESAGYKAHGECCKRRK